MNHFKLFITVALAVALVLGAYDWYNKRHHKAYVTASHIMEGFQQSSIFKTYASDLLASTGKLPSSNEEIDLQEASYFSGYALVSVEITEGGVIIMKYNEKSGVDNGIIKLIPDLSNHTLLRWKCVTPSYKDIEEFVPQCQYLP